MIPPNVVSYIVVGSPPGLAVLISDIAKLLGSPPTIDTISIRDIPSVSDGGENVVMSGAVAAPLYMAATPAVLVTFTCNPFVPMPCRVSDTPTVPGGNVMKLFWCRCSMPDASTVRPEASLNDIP